MSLYNTPSKMLSLSLILSSVFFSNAHAGLVRVINQNTDPVILAVIPEPVSEQAPYCWKCLTGICEMPQKRSADLLISSECFPGNDRFSVVGTTGGFLFNGRCGNLSLSKNYEITFTDDFVGTSCISREL